MGLYDGLSESIKRKYAQTYTFKFLIDGASTGMVPSDSEGGPMRIISTPYTHEDVTPKNLDFVWCDWCGSKNHYRDLKCSSCGGTL